VTPDPVRAHGVLDGYDEVVELGDLGPWRPKLVASDLDGTLLAAGSEVSPRTRAALDACWAAGIPVVGVTGRGPRLLDSVRDALDGRGIAVLKVFLRSATLGQDELLARARSVVDPADAEITHAGLGFIEVLPPGVTKATGLAVALERYGVGLGDVLVFGDMPNDLPMITAVRDAGGRSVAVANAHPSVRAAAQDRTSGHDVDGVARYLEALFGGGPRGV
jgi:hydroxymethylpyrimidine pyrophosphatase-like HAD family hydrolase